MKRIFTIAFFAVAVLLLSDSSAQAQHGYRLEKQLKFAPGKTSAAIKGRIADEQETHEYKFKARKNQFVEIRIVSKNTNMSFLVTNAADEDLGEAAPKTLDWEMTLTETGEYRILVHTLSGRGNYTLFVTIN